MSGQKAGPPSVFSEGAERTSGKAALRMNIMAASVVADAVRSTFGPMGMDKMLVDSLGDVTKVQAMKLIDQLLSPAPAGNARGGPAHA